MAVAQKKIHYFTLGAVGTLAEESKTRELSSQRCGEQMQIPPPGLKFSTWWWISTHCFVQAARKWIQMAGWRSGSRGQKTVSRILMISMFTFQPYSEKEVILASKARRHKTRFFLSLCFRDNKPYCLRSTERTHTYWQYYTCCHHLSSSVMLRLASRIGSQMFHELMDSAIRFHIQNNRDECIYIYILYSYQAYNISDIPTLAVFV